MEFSLDYSKMVFLDAEELAEGGIQAAYKDLLPELLKYVQEADEITEVLEDEAPSYSVHHQDREYVIYGPETEVDESWDNATYALFSIVNAQLAGSPCRFYAINGGNELGGMFLTSEQYESAMRSIERKSDWPYFPSDQPPAYGHPS
jgi:hypothetical protein